VYFSPDLLRPYSFLVASGRPPRLPELRGRQSESIFEVGHRCQYPHPRKHVMNYHRSSLASSSLILEAGILHAANFLISFIPRMCMINPSVISACSSNADGMALSFSQGITAPWDKDRILWCWKTGRTRGSRPRWHETSSFGRLPTPSFGSSRATP
jgi:hypothetical protein